MTDLPSSPARATCRRCLGRALAATLVAAAVLLVGATPAAAAERPIRFDHLTIRDGLSQNTVLAVHQDRDHVPFGYDADEAAHTFIPLSDRA